MAIQASAMKIIESAVLNSLQKEAVLKLWNSEYPVALNLNNMYELEAYLIELKKPKHFLLVNEMDNLVGWLIVFKREQERWFAMILSKEVQGKGYGSELLNLAKSQFSKLNGWVINHDNDIKMNGEPYSSPLIFYLKNHFKVLHGQKLVTEKLSAIQIVWKGPK